MPHDFIQYETKSDRELLVVVAQAINSLNEKTVQLCNQVEVHSKLINENREKFSEQEVKIVKLIADNVYIAKSTTETLEKVHCILEKQDKELGDLRPISKFFWWVVGIIGAIITGILVYILTHFKFPLG